MEFLSQTGEICDKDGLRTGKIHNCRGPEGVKFSLAKFSLFFRDTLDNSIVESELSEEAQVILDRYRLEVLEELQRYYQNELGLKDFSIRLGNIMSLNHTIQVSQFVEQEKIIIFQECRSLFKVFMRFFTTIFDVFITENSLKEFLF